ncbi:hypothetical protein Tco_0735768 [Tanacetum coccineum]
MTKAQDQRSQSMKEQALHTLERDKDSQSLTTKGSISLIHGECHNDSLRGLEELSGSYLLSNRSRCIGHNVIEISSDKVKGSRDWNSVEYQDTAVRKEKKLVKKELIVALNEELYFVKFIINPEEDDVKPGVIFGRSFLILAKGVVDFRNRVITIYPEPDTFKVDSEKTGKSSDD